MSRPPFDTRNRPAVDYPSRGSILVGYALVAAFVPSLWIASRPLTGAVVLAAAAGLWLCVRRVVRLIRCFSDCGGFSLDLGGRVRITISQPSLDDSS